MAFFFELAIGDTLAIGDGTRLVLEKKSGQRARFRIESDQDVERFKVGERVPPMKPAPGREPVVTPAQPAAPRAFLQRPKA
jgi:hypothetical protein